jgi:hypothetical protein
MPEWTPYQQGIIDRINSGQTDYTFGPGAPGASREDRGTYVGGPYSPAGGFAVPGGVALAPQEYYAFTPAERQALGIMDIAPRDQAGQVERYYPGGKGNVFSRTFSTATNPGRAAGNFWSEHFGNARGTDWSPQQLAAAGIPYYPEGSPTSEALGPALEGAFGDNPRGLQYGGIFGTPGTGAPTRNIAGLAGAALGSALFPGAGLITGPMAKWITGQVQAGKFGGGPRGSPINRPAVQPQSRPTGGGNAPSGGYYSPQYLRSIGYEPGQGTDSLWPGGPPASGPNTVGDYGVGGGGGSFFHDLAGVRGGPLAGAFAGLGSGGGGEIGGGLDNALAATLAEPGCE